MEFEIHHRTGEVRCAGCGTPFYALPALLNSSIRGEPYGPQGRRGAPPEVALRLGTSASKVTAFAKEHAGCPVGRREVTPSGIVCVDRRRFARPEGEE